MDAFFLQGLDRILDVFVRNRVQQRLAGITHHAAVSRCSALVQSKHALNILNRLVQQRGNFLRRRLMIKRLRKITRCAEIDIDFLDHMNRQTNGTCLVHDGAFNGLSYPPGAIGRKTKTEFGIKLFHRTNESKIAFLDKIEKSQTAVHIAPGDLYHQAQVTLDHALARRFITLLRKP